MTAILHFYNTGEYEGFVRSILMFIIRGVLNYLIYNGKQLIDVI